MEGARGRQGAGLRAPPRAGPTAIDPETGERYDDLLVVTTANLADKAALVEDDRRRSSRSTTSTTTQPCSSSSRGSVSSVSTSSPRSSPRPGRSRPSDWSRSSSRMAKGDRVDAPAWRRTTSSRPCASTTPTPTSRCRRCSPSTSSKVVMRPSPPSCVRHDPLAGDLRRDHRRLPDRPQASSRPRCATRCDWASTSCSRCACRTTRRSAPASTSSGPGSASARPVSPTPCCARSAPTTSMAGWLAWHRIRRGTRSATRRSPSRTRAGSSRHSATRWTRRPSCPRCWPPTTPHRR